MSDVHSSCLAIFQPPNIEKGIVSEKYVEYRPTGSITNGSIIEFNINDTNPEYVSLKKSRLHIRVKITKPDGTPIKRTKTAKPDGTGNDYVAFVNLSMSSLFRQVDILLNQKNTSADVGVNYPWKSMIDVLLNYGHDIKETALQGELYYKDTSGTAMEATNPQTGGNGGLLERDKWTKNGGIVSLEGPLHADLCQIDRMLPNSVPIRIKLHPTEDSFRLMSDNDTKYQVVITDASLKLCQVTVNPSVIVAHNETFNLGDAIYPYWKSDVKVHGVAKGSRIFNTDDLLGGMIPARVFVGIVSSDAYAGSYKKNPFNFYHYNVDYVDLSVNGNSVPSNPFQPNYEKEDYIRSYMSLFKNKYPTHSGNFIHRRDYPDGYCIYCFELDAMMQNNVMTTPKKGQTRLSIRFGKDLEHPVTIIVYSQIASVMKIDKTRNILL